MEVLIAKSLSVAALAGMALLVCRSVYSGYVNGEAKTHVCPNCRSVIRPREVVPGSVLLGVLLWLFFLVPGILYTAWCFAHKRVTCPVCGARNPVPLTTPAGRELTQNRSPLA